MKPLCEENSTPTASISTKQNSPYPQTRRPFYEDLSDSSLKDECLSPRDFPLEINRTPGRRSTLQIEVKTRCLLLRGRSIIITGWGVEGGESEAFGYFMIKFT